MEENKWRKEVHSHVWPHKNKQILCFSPFYPHVEMCSRVNLWGMKAFPISHICTSSAQLYIWHLYFLSIQIQSNPTSALKNCFCSSRTISSCCEEICNNEYFSLSSYNIRSHISLYDSIKIQSKWIFFFNRKGDQSNGGQHVFIFKTQSPPSYKTVYLPPFL